MNTIDIITRKRDGARLENSEIEYVVKGITSGEIPDYQAAALLMAIYFQGLDREEIFALTKAMKYSGDTIDLSGIKGIKVDKHSTGGVGDKTTLIAGPLAAACGIPVAKMSGRGLGFTGGTVDKLESIEGFRIALEPEEFEKQVNEIGISVIGQTAHVAPADKKIYALRDVTATVNNEGLIASSIMSKKLASGSNAIVLDVKCGKGAFMENLEDATSLGELMVDIGGSDNVKTIAVITDMNQPLGRTVGNSLEVIEAIETLKGNGPADITELSLSLSAMMVYAGGKAESPEEGRRMTEEALKSGRALAKLQEMIAMQGGNPQVIGDYSKFEQAGSSLEVFSPKEGYVTSLNAGKVGLASQHAGAGREKKEDDVDPAAGIYIDAKVGDYVKKGQRLATVYASDSKKAKIACEEVSKAYEIENEKPEEPILIKKIIGI